MLCHSLPAFALQMLSDPLPIVSLPLLIKRATHFQPLQGEMHLLHSAHTFCSAFGVALN